MACTTITKKGRDLLVRYLDGSPIASFDMASSSSISISGELVDVSTKGGNGWREAAGGAGLRTATISMNGTFKSTALESSLQTLAMSNEVGEFDIIDEDGEKYSGCFIVTSYEKAGDFNTIITWNAVLESASEITYTSV